MSKKTQEQVIYWVRTWITCLEHFAPSGSWQKNELVQRWFDWQQRNLLTEDEYTRLESYLAKCYQRVYHNLMAQQKQATQPTGDRGI